LWKHEILDQVKLFIWEEAKCSTRILRACSKVWQIVRTVLCVDSPEGQNFASNEDEAILDIGVKDTLSFAWRALKESASLMLAMLLAHDSSLATSLGYEELSLIGELSFMQLSELRHRGAFSTVSQTFATCCAKAAQSSDPRIANLPKLWYARMLECIQDKASTLTRRSAGLPALFTGVLGAFTHDVFSRGIVAELLRIAQTPVEGLHAIELRLPQVHALNCLKDAFTQTHLVSVTEDLLSEALRTAAQCLEVDM